MAKTFTLLAALLIVFAIGATSAETVNTATEAPTTPTTTKAPTTMNKAPLTTAPLNTTTTEAPTTMNKAPLTTAPLNTTTTEAPTATAEGNSTTTAEASSGSTGSTGSPATTHSGATKPPTSATQTPATTEIPNACASNPCGDGSTCEPRANKTYVCLCLAGDFYNNDTSSCQKAKVFPGRLGLTIQFQPEMINKKSAIFKETSEEIISELDNIYSKENKQYSGSTVLKLQKKINSKVISKTIDTEASIEIIFQANSEVTSKDVTEVLKNNNCSGCILNGSDYEAEDLCKNNACDEKTTQCKPGDGSFSCSCRSGYIKTYFTDRICVECPSGFKAKDSRCVPCGFGYSGFNCEDSRLLGVVIAASVLGGLLLIAIIVMPIVVVKMKKKGSKKNTYEDIGKPYVSHSVAKIPAANSSKGMSSSFRGPASGVAAPAAIPRIPRATGGSNWDNRTNLEMAPSNSRQNLVSSGRNGWINDDQDDTFKFGQSRPQTNQYEQIRPQQNPYSQSSSVNPYAQRQGNHNPYFMSDDDRYSR